MFSEKRNKNENRNQNWEKKLINSNKKEYDKGGPLKQLKHAYIKVVCET